MAKTKQQQKLDKVTRRDSGRLQDGLGTQPPAVQGDTSPDSTWIWIEDTASASLEIFEEPEESVLVEIRSPEFCC